MKRPNMKGDPDKPFLLTGLAMNREDGQYLIGKRVPALKGEHRYYCVRESLQNSKMKMMVPADSIESKVLDKFCKAIETCPEVAKRAIIDDWKIAGSEVPNTEALTANEVISRAHLHKLRGANPQLLRHLLRAFVDHVSVGPCSNGEIDVKLRIAPR
jgi:hypothetical protein